MASPVQDLCIKQENSYLSERGIAYQIDKSVFPPRAFLHKAKIFGRFKSEPKA